MSPGPRHIHPSKPCDINAESNPRFIRCLTYRGQWIEHHMILSAELFEQIAEALKSDGRPGTSKDKPAGAARVGMTGEVTCSSASAACKRRRGLHLPSGFATSPAAASGLYHNKRFAKDHAAFIIELNTFRGELRSG